MFRRSIKYAVAVAGLASLVASTSASAAGEKFLVRAGLAQVNSNATSDDIDGGVDVGNATGLGINLTYLFTPNIGVEVLGASPFTHDIELPGAGKVAETKELPPTVLFVVRGDAGALHPYVGLGLNYTMFFSEETKGALAGTDLKLDDSFGPAFEAGVDYDLNDKWFLNASLWYMNIRTDATVTAGGVTIAEGNVQINPVAALFTVGTRF
jgi:outer membrane protein